MKNRIPRIPAVLAASFALTAVALPEVGAQTTLAEWTLSYPSGTVNSVTSTGDNATTVTAPTGNAPSGAMYGEYAGTNFDPSGSGDWLQSSGVVSYLNFAASSAFTIEAWVYAESISSVGRNILSTRTASSIDPTNPGFSLYQRGTAAGSGSGELGFIVDFGSAAVVVNSTGTAMSLDTWHHVAVTRTEAGVITLYLDGSVVGQNTASNIGAITSQDSTYIGRAANSGDVNSMWDGGINVVRISDAALAPANFVALQAAIPEPSQFSAAAALMTLLFVYVRRRRS